MNNNIKPKFLVCISSSPSSEKIIRWTAKTAKAFNAKWIALYIETPDSLNKNKDEMKLLNNNIELAKSLEGEFVQIEGFNIAISVAEFAKQADITNIVIGKSREKNTIKKLFTKSLEEQIIDLLGNVEVHIIPASLGEYKSKRKKEKIQFHLFDVFITICALFIASSVCAIMKLLDLSNINYILIYELAVMIVSLITKGYIYGVISSLISVLLYDYLYVEPNYSFHLISSEYIIIIISMLIVSLIISMLTSRVKIRTVHSIKREKKLESLFVLSQKIINTSGYENIITILKDYFSFLFKSNVVIYKKINNCFIALEENYIIKDSELSILEWINDNKDVAGKYTKNFDKENKYYFPIYFQENECLIVGLECNENIILGYEEQTFIKMASTQFALAFEKQSLHDIQQDTLIIAEKEKTRSNLLRAVSHDLRTPLTAIYGSASMISDGKLDETKIKEFALSICDDTQWLIRMVENLLTVTKIKDDGIKLQKQLEVLEEVISESVSKIKTRTGFKNIQVKVPDELLLVPMDGMLIEQVIINLLDNSIRHSGSKEDINIIAYKLANNVVIEIIDQGIGFNKEEIDMIERGVIKSYNNSSDAKKGMGIGLSICYSIINAHNGKLIIMNQEYGGAKFTITLPLEEINE